MPRIEYLPTSYDPNSGDGSPTIDVCAGCSTDFEEGEPMPEVPGEPDAEGAETGSTDVDHPPFDECDYNCAVCGEELTEDDD